MDAATAVKLVIIAFEIICAVILAGLMSRAVGVRPVRAMIQGVEILAFMVLAILPAPTVARHRPVTS